MVQQLRKATFSQTKSSIGVSKIGQSGSDIVVSSQKSLTKNKDTVNESRNFPFNGALHLERKRQMDHELSMARTTNKRLKYEFKEKILAADHEFRLKKIEAEQHLGELRLQLELERLRASRVHTASAFSIPPIHIPPDGNASENTSVSLDLFPPPHLVFAPVCEKKK